MERGRKREREREKEKRERERERRERERETLKGLQPNPATRDKEGLTGFRAKPQIWGSWPQRRFQV